MMDSKVADEASGIILALSEDTTLPHGIKFHLKMKIWPNGWKVKELGMFAAHPIILRHKARSSDGIKL